MRVQDVMKKRVESIDAMKPVSAAVEQMRQKSIRHLVVTRDDHVVGIVSDGDVRMLQESDPRSVHDVMAAHVVSATSGMTLRKAANLMRGRSVGCLPVVDEGRLVGIVTTSDLLERIGRGAERPTTRGKRWTLKDRGPRRKALAGRRDFAAH
jgi:acetoin utilization protein AcuB